MSAIARNTTPQLLPAAANRGQRALLENSPPTLIRTMDLDEVRQLARVVKFLVLLPAPGVEDGVASAQVASGDSFLGPSASLNIPDLFHSAATHVKNDPVDGYVQVGDVKVNFSTMEADRAGKPLSLTTLEFKTLKYLVDNARRVISRDELLNEVWGYENYPSTRTVDNQVAKLRKKLEPDPSRPVHLRTVHGAGYKFLP